MPEFVVPAESRSETGKNVNRRLRSRGLIPGVVYGTGKGAVAVAVSPREIGAILKSASGENTLFDLDLGGTRRKVILKEFQREPLRGQILHADFYEVALDKVLEVKVHVELVGVPVGVKLQGGLVDFVTRELELECLPADIPEKIVADISHLELGKHLRVSELSLGDKVKVLTEADLVIAHVVLPRAEVVAEAAAVEAAPEAGAAEPEVIKKGKTEKAEGEAEEKPEKGAKAEKGGKPEKGEKKEKK
jgi:large subunit ribosomal protein L25